jgi:para-aminobenzoate synthetase/4-amino-4-deoxychorismate lyase
VLRAELLESGAVEARVLTLDDLARCQELYLVNSLRGWRRAQLAPAADR